MKPGYGRAIGVQVERIWRAGLCLAVSLLVACSSSGPYFQDFDETLSIQVLPNASKLFVYSVSAPERHRRNLVEVYRSPQQASQHRNREPEGQRTYRQLRDNVERALTLTGYCREGYLEFDYRLSRDDLWLRGECRESATEQDIERFAGRDELPVPQPER